MNNKDMTIQKWEKNNLPDSNDKSRCNKNMELTLGFFMINVPKNNLDKFPINQEKQLDHFLMTHTFF